MVWLVRYVNPSLRDALGNIVIERVEIGPDGQRSEFAARNPDASCPGAGKRWPYHDAKTFVGRFGANHAEIIAPAEDPRWPAVCEGCGRAFAVGDERLIRRSPAYANDIGLEYGLCDLPPGAMWLADWLAGFRDSEPHKALGGGPHLLIRLPSGEDWDVDAPSSNGGVGWTRHGLPPAVSASPSVQTPNWHGHLIGGELVPC